MNKLVIALTLAVALLVIAMPTTVSAEEDKQTQTQKLEQSYEVECTTGSYGQSTCKVKGTNTGEQTQTQYIRRADGRIIRVHKPVNTGVPAALIGGSAIVSVVGAGVLLAKRK